MKSALSNRALWQEWRGLLVPAGSIADVSGTRSTTYLRIKQNALQLEDLYRANRCRLAPTSEMARLIYEAKRFSDDWLLGKELFAPQLFRVGQFNRIAEALLAAREDARLKYFLSRFSSGSLDLLRRRRSAGKDALWELELWSSLRGWRLKAMFDEPDIVVPTKVGNIGIACKKLYSENNVEKVISKAVAQIEGTFAIGIVALNLDDLRPDDVVLRAPTLEVMAHRLDQINSEFLVKHERMLRKYLSSERASAVMVSTGVLADVYRKSTRFNIARQATIWMLPRLRLEASRALDILREHMVRYA